MRIDDHASHEGHDHGEHEDIVMLSAAQGRALGLEMGGLSERVMQGNIRANGEVSLPPQQQASVSAVRGGYISSIRVEEGAQVAKGQILCYLKHPDFISLQGDYLKAKARLKFLDLEYARLDTLNQRQIAARREFEEVMTERESMQAECASLAQQLALIGINPEEIGPENMQQTVALRSPINGAISHIDTKIGQYAGPEDELFLILNTGHVHVDLLVYAQESGKVKIGQEVRIQPGDVQGEVYAVGKSMESDPPRLRVHVRVEHSENLLAGSYVTGEILVSDNHASLAIPDDGIAMDGDQAWVFQQIVKEGFGGEFAPVAVRKGISSNGFTEIFLPEAESKPENFVLKGAYYLLAEWKKEEAGHGHSH
ncbi:MAG: efflux RND transporter periplasmic adaptor subunit [Bacteroidia bacterium]